MTVVYTQLNAQPCLAEQQAGVSTSHRSQEGPGTTPQLKYF